MLQYLIIIPLFCFLIYIFSRFKSNDTDSYADNTDGRKLFGRPLLTSDDWDQWWVLKGFSDAINYYLIELWKSIAAGTCDDMEATAKLWQEKYQHYRTLCMQHGMWNLQLGDQKPFIPTKEQQELERLLYQRLQLCLTEGAELKIARENETALYNKRCAQILDYINLQPKKVAMRHQIITAIVGSDQDMRSIYAKVCRRMVKEGVLSESKDDSGKIILKKKRRTNKKSKDNEFHLPSATYQPERYFNVSRKTLYKVLYTVGTPISVDKTTLSCVFFSLTDGQKYYTSVSACTCPAFSKQDGIPCKHMVALASHLGLFHSPVLTGKQSYT